MIGDATPGDFWKFADKDIKVAELCYKSKNYNNVVFHMQQAYEKTAKGILLGIFLTEEGKDSFKRSFDKELFEQSALQKIICLTLDLIKGYGHNWQNNLIKVTELFCEAIEKCKVKNLSFFGFNEKERDDLSKELNKFREFSKSEKSIENALSESGKLLLKREQYASSGPVGSYFYHFLELLELAYIGCVLNAFENLSRYPSPKNKLDNFNSDTPIIKNFELIKTSLVKHLPRFS